MSPVRRELVPVDWDWLVEPLDDSLVAAGLGTSAYHLKDLARLPLHAIRLILEPFLPAMERALGPITTGRGGPEPLGREVLGAGYEGIVIGAYLVDLDEPVVIKLGGLIEPYHPVSSDFVASAQIVGEDIPGVAKVYGVWAFELVGKKAQGTELLALVRERVSTDWAEFERLVPLEGPPRPGRHPDHQWPLDEFWDGVRDWMPAIATACLYGRPPESVAQGWPGEGGVQEFLEWQSWPPAQSFFEGIRNLAARRICAGDDIKRDNMGWRFGPDGMPELVILDLGLSDAAGDWTESPRRPNRRRRR